MKSKALFFNLERPLFSAALLKENLRKTWPLCLLLFLVLFLPICLMGILKMGDMDIAVSYAETCLNNSHFIFITALVVFPVLTSIMLFKYLHNTGSTTVIHAMPFTRAALFFTNLVSGAIILIIPIVINGLLMIPFMRGFTDYVKSQEYYDEVWVTSFYEPFGTLNILNWIAVTLLIVMFIYVFSVLAGMVSGNIPMHVINSALFNFAPTLIVYVICSYLGIELFGFNFSDTVSRLLPWLSPIFNENSVIGLGRYLLFLLIIVIAVLLSNFLYGRRKLEKAGESLAFKFMEPVVVFLITLLSVALVCTYIYAINGKADAVFYFCVGIGSVIALIVANMIVQKTPKIFNSRALLSSGIYSIVIILFITSAAFDVFNLEKRVPEADKVSSVNLDTPAIIDKPYLDIDYFSESGASYISKKPFRSKEAVNYIVGFHNDIVNDEDLIRKNKSNSLNEYDWNMNINYKMGRRSMSRSYNFRNVDFSHNENLKGLIDTEEFRKNMSLSEIGAKNAKRIEADIHYIENLTEENIHEGEPQYSYDMKTYNLSIQGHEMDELIKNLDRDFKEQTSDQLLNASPPIVNLNIILEEGENEEERRIAYALSETYRHSIKWLKDKGYYDGLVLTLNDVEKIGVELVDYSGNILNSYQVTRPEDIKNLWNNRASTLYMEDEGNYAVLNVTYKKNGLDKFKNHLQGDGSGSVEGRVMLDMTLSEQNTVNRFYIEKGNPAYQSIKN